MPARKADPIKTLYQKLTALKKYTPSKKVDALFTDLVHFVLDPHSTNSLSQKEVQKLQVICQQAEYELEKYWTKKIIQSKRPQAILERFPYIANYRKLTQMEWFSLLSCAMHKNHRLLFIGGGPLPLTALVLARDYGQTVTVLDIQKEACVLSKKIVQKLGLEKYIDIVEADAALYDGYKKYSVIVIAALAGVEKEIKEKILLRIKKSAPRDAHILARSSWGTREILYRPLDPALYTIFKPLLEVRPQHDVINSVVIFSNS